MKTLLLAAALVAIPLTAIAQDQTPPPATGATMTPEQMVDARQSKMGRGGGALARLKQANDAGTDLSTLTTPLQFLVSWGEELPTLFPAGTDVAGTDARAEVWSNAAGFAAEADRFKAATRALAAAAAANDRAAFTAAWTEARASCQSCHTGFKN